MSSFWHEIEAVHPAPRRHKSAMKREHICPMLLIAVYRYHHDDAGLVPERPWGTVDAILDDGCVPIGRSARRVPFALLDRDGFLPAGVSPKEP
jgi:hypothetical protein